MKKRILSVLLALCMCLTFVPVTVLAEDLQQGNGISVLSITPDEDTYYTYVFTVDGKEINRQIVKDGDTLLEPQVPAQDGKVFTGWSPKVTFGPVSGLTGENQTFEVEAQFEYGYHVYFKDDSGRIIATETVTNGTKVTFEDVNFPVGSDEAITGWYTDKDYTNKVDSVTINGADITLYAKVEKGYWLTFESNGGSYVAPAFYANGTTAKSPDEPTKSGYTFAGWYTDGDLKTPASFDSITASTTLYAKWTAGTETKYTVIHFWENANDDGYSFKESETKTGATGDKTNAGAKSYQGFTAQTITQQEIAGDGSTIVKVYYKRNVYSVRFYSNSGIFGSSKEYTSLRITAKYGAYIGDQWPTYDDSNAWATTDNGSTYQSNIDTMPLNGASFYGPRRGWGSETAYYYVEVLPGETGTPGPGNLNYKLHHSDTSPGTGYRVTDEDKYPITGFTFKTFSAEWNWGEYNYDQAKFYYTRNSYDLVFVSNGSDEHTVSKKFEQSIADVNYTPKALTGEKSDYVFAGWYASKECTGEAYDFTGKTMPANNITLYAKWVAPTYTVTVYDQNGTKLDEITVSKGDTVTDELSRLEAQLKLTLTDGDSFLGWTFNRGLRFNPGTKITTNYELYAKVGNSTGYSVTYNANGGTGSVTDTEKYAKGAEATVMSNSFTNDGKVFLSWNTAADGSGKTYYPNRTVKITGDVTLYAQWGDKASTVSVTYHSNFGTDVAQSAAAVANNSKITVEAYNALNLPERTGYSFVGWNTEADGTGRTFAAGAFARVDVTEPNDLYAQWTPNTDTTYKVEFYYQNDDGSYPSTASKTEPRTGTTDTTVSVTNADKEAKEDGKYVYDTTAANVESGKVAADGSLVLKLYFKLNQFQLTINYVYADGTTAATSHSETLTVGNTYSVNSPTINGYTADKTVVSGTMPAENVVETVAYTKRTDLSYTVHYYWNGTTESVAPDKTVPGQTFNASVTESPIAIEGYTAVSNARQTITIGTGTNEINFYYYKNVELTAVSDSKVYNGSEQTISGYTGAPEGVTFNGISASGSGTDVGEYGVTFGEGTVGKVDTTNKYIVTETTPGKLTIAKRDVTVTGESATKVYNGQTQEINGYTVDNLVKGHEMTGVIYSAKGKDPGKYDGSFTGSQIVIKDADGNYVTANYNVKPVIGVLTITQPSHPTRPSTPTKDVTSVKTADGSQMTLWMSMMLASAAGIVFLGKKRKEEQ